LLSPCTPYINKENAAGKTADFNVIRSPIGQKEKGLGTNTQGANIVEDFPGKPGSPTIS